MLNSEKYDIGHLLEKMIMKTLKKQVSLFSFRALQFLLISADQ